MRTKLSVQSELVVVLIKSQSLGGKNRQTNSEKRHQKMAALQFSVDSFPSVHFSTVPKMYFKRPNMEAF